MLILQVINGISRVLQNLLKCFNDTIIWTSFVSSFPVWPVTFYLYLNEALSGSSGTSIKIPLLFKYGSRHKLPDVFK